MFINQESTPCSSNQMHVHVIMHDLPYLHRCTITPQHLCINACSSSHEYSCDSTKHKPYSSIYQSKYVKQVILLTLMLNMWKLDSTRPKHVIKTNQNKQNSKNPKSIFLGTSMSVHEWSMHYACLKYAYAYIV